MHFFDVCNGDADGLCAVLQWRLATPRPARLVTGFKRDIDLLQHVQAARGDEVLVCDLSMQRNHAALLRLLQQGIKVRWFDHHKVEPIPQHPGLQADIDFDPRVCTSLLVDRALSGRFRAWALVGAYGDNLSPVADALAGDMGLDQPERQTLRSLGEGINYNAYGDEPADQHIAPQRLYALMARHAHPLQFWQHEAVGRELDALRRADLQHALAQPVHAADSGARFRLLPDAPWSRRVIGVLANEMAAAEPHLAHAVFKADRRDGHVVSLRAPVAAPAGAHALCAAFGGGGRAGAAGIDHLPHSQFERFVAALAAARWGR